MPEAEAMQRYLVSQGIPESMIRAETQSKNTFENMTYYGGWSNVKSAKTK